MHTHNVLYKYFTTINNFRYLFREKADYSNFNASRPRQNGHHFPYDIFKYIFVNENV